MRIQIYGGGISGSFLYFLLGRDFEVGIKDVRSSPDCGCAWGTVYREARTLYQMIGINFDEYGLVKPGAVIINGVRLRNCLLYTSPSPRDRG